MRPLQLFQTILLSLLLSQCTQPDSNPNTSQPTTPPRPNSSTPILDRTDYAYIFYVSKFNSNGWPSLPDTKSEAIQLDQELTGNYNFQTELIANPTKKQILDKIRRINRRQFGPHDQILFFFSSHGHFAPGPDRGFLIPTDGKSQSEDPYGDSWLSYDDLGADITFSNCQHILLALDACYSGAFGDRWKGQPEENILEKETDCNTQIQKTLQYNSRLYLTSGARDRRTPARSKFADRFLTALRQGGPSGMLRTYDLRYFLGSIESPSQKGAPLPPNTKLEAISFLCTRMPVLRKPKPSPRNKPGIKFESTPLKMLLNNISRTIRKAPT